MSDDPIYPTHTCFDDALDILRKLVLEQTSKGLPVPTNIWVVHAICLVPDDNPTDAGKPFAHAWVEQDVDIKGWPFPPAPNLRVAWQCGIWKGDRILYSAAADEVRGQLRIQDETRYTAVQALHENLKHNHYGPWEERYRRLCRNHQTGDSDAH
jgi:hypothetical protein